MEFRKFFPLLCLEVGNLAFGVFLDKMFPESAIWIWAIVAVAFFLIGIFSWPEKKKPAKGIKARDGIMFSVVFVFVVFVVVFGVLKPSQKKHISCLDNEELRRIDWAIEEKNAQHFEQEIRNLYPYLIKCGLKAPLIDPVRIGHSMYDNTWYGFHLAFLKVLRRQIRNGEFEADQWNTDVDRENAKRRNAAERHIGRGTKAGI